MKRMSEERIPKKVMEWLPPERLKRGRPTTTSIQGITTTMRERRLEEGQWVNREDWRESLKLVFKTRILGTGRCVYIVKPVLYIYIYIYIYMLYTQYGV